MMPTILLAFIAASTLEAGTGCEFVRAECSALFWQSSGKAFLLISRVSVK